MEKTAVRRPIEIAVALTVGVVGAYVVWSASQSRFYSADSVNELVTEFSKTAVPSGGNALENMHVSSKMTFQTVYADFRAPMSADELANYYTRVLGDRNWVVVEKRSAARGGRFLKFCKGDLNAVLETIDSSAIQTRYYFGIERSGEVRERTGSRTAGAERGRCGTETT